MKSIKFIVLTSKLLLQKSRVQHSVKKSEETKCDNRNMALMKANHKFFKMDPYYPETLPATLLNYMNQRQEESELYDITSQI